MFPKSAHVGGMAVSALCFVFCVLCGMGLGTRLIPNTCCRQYHLPVDDDELERRRTAEALQQTAQVDDEEKRPVDPKYNSDRKV